MTTSLFERVQQAVTASDFTSLRNVAPGGDSIYQYQLCLLIALMAHGTKADRQGVPYIQHPIRVSMNPKLDKDMYARAASLVHDVIEDTALTLFQMRELGVCEKIIDYLSYMTHDPIYTYEEYIDRMIAVFKTSPLYWEGLLLFKQADMEDNSNIKRNATLDVNPEKILKRAMKYTLNYAKLQVALDEEFP